MIRTSKDVIIDVVKEGAFEVEKDHYKGSEFVCTWERVNG